jgi:predicted NBD/HSP70 family sugar kinase
MTLTAGVDIGGSSVTSVARNAAGEIVGRFEASSAIDGGQQMAALAVSAVEALDLRAYDAVGVGVPGQVDPRAGRLTMAVNLGIGTEPYDLAGHIEAALGVPVTIENDVRAAALGAYESLRLDGRAPDSLALVSIGTGISAGVVVEGVLLRGAHGMAGEIGHVVVDETGGLCACGQRGCLEAMAAGPAIARAWPQGSERSAATALFSAAAAGDPAAEKVAGRIIGHLTTALIWLAAAYDTELIVLAGGVSAAGEPFLGMVRNEVALRGAGSEIAARRLRPEQVILMESEDPPGPRGAALLAANHLVQIREAPAGRKAGNDT